MAFPDNALDLRPELKVGTSWVNVKGDAFTRDPITVTRGRADESSRPSASSCSMTVNNTTAKYSPRNPESPYWGKIGRNTPMRLSLPVDLNSNYVHMLGSDTFGFYSPDSAAIDLLAGDMDLMVEIDGTGLIGRDQTLICRADPATNQRSFQFGINADGTLYFWFDEDGLGNTIWYGESDTAVPYTQGGTIALRVTIDHNNANDAPNVRTYATFWHAPTLDGPWTDVGVIVVADSSALFFSGNAPLRLGYGRFHNTDPQIDRFGNGLVGKIYRARFYQGWLGFGGTLVASPDFRTQPGGTTTFVDAQGVTWSGSADATNGQAYVVDREYVYQGEVAEWPQRWEGSAEQSVRVELEAAGVLRRLTQGASALNSPYYRGIVNYPDENLRAYWPCEDEAGSTSFASAVPGIPPMAISTVAKPDMSSDSEHFPASLGLPKINGSTWLADLAPADWNGIQTPGVGITVTVFIPAGSVLDNTVLMRVADQGTIRRWDVTYTSAGGGTLTARGYDTGGTVRLTLPATTAVDGKAAQFQLAYYSSGSVYYANTSFTWLTSGNTSTSAVNQSGFVVGYGAGRPLNITMNVGGGASGDCVIGNLAVHDGTLVNTYSAITQMLLGNYGESSGARFRRLCDEEGVPVRWRGDLLATEKMGIQPVATLEELLFECVEAENGVMFEPNDVLGLGFRTRESLFNQDVHLALDYQVGGEVMPPMEPDESDAGLANRVIASRSGGSKYTAELPSGPLSILPPPAGVGLYENSVTVNVQTDAQLRDQAAWRLSLGTVDDSRFPVIKVNVREAPYLFGAVISTLLGDRLQVQNPPKWLPPHTIDQLMQGTKTVYRPFDYSVEINCSPATPWSVAVTNSTAARADTAGCVVAKAHTPTDTALYVETTRGPVWTTDPAQYPFDLIADGEQVTATACAPLVLDTFERTVANGWGSTDTGDAWNPGGGTAANYAVNSGFGHIISTSRIGRRMTVPQPTENADIQVTFVVSELPKWTVATDKVWEVRLYLRHLSATTRYYASAQIDSTGGLGVTGFSSLGIYKDVGGVNSQVAFLGVNVVPIVAGLEHNLRFQVVGSTLRAKVWRNYYTEPEWMLTGTDTSITGTGSMGVASTLGTGTTNTLPITMSFNDFVSKNGQKFTVQRSVNGVVKSHAYGGDVRLAKPATTSF